MKINLKQKSCVIFSHNDLDGAGCIILSKLAFKYVNFKINGYNNIDNKIIEFLESERLNKNAKTYDYLFITDISISDETIEAIENSPYKDTYYLIDHHDTRTDLHDGEHIFVIVNDSNGVQNSGTNLFMEFLEYKFDYTFDNKVSYFVDMVRSWDTWLWKEQELEIPIDLNILCTEFNIVDFIKNMCIKLSNNMDFSLFTQDERKLISQVKEKIQWYYKNLNYRTYENDGKTVAYLFADEYISYIADMFLTDNPEVDYVMLLNPRRGFASIRTQKDNIHVGEIAEKFGGGGHVKASGFSISEDKLNVLFDILNELFK